MSLRFRLISLIAIVLAANLTVEAAIVSFHASRSVRTEMNSALQVGRQFVENALADLPNSKDPRGNIETLVAAFKGNRHLRISQSGGDTFIAPTIEGSLFGMVPRWFVRLLGITPLTAKVPIAIAGQNYGSILIETDPNNEILEVWNDLGDGFVVLALFFGLNILLVYVYIGRALRPLDQLASALQQIGHGDYKLRIGGHMVPELSRLQWSFNRMATELAELDGEKRRLNEQLLTLQEEDRREIARDLHDEISPFLFAINAGLASISRLAHQGRGAEIAGEIQSTSEAVSHIQRQIRTMLSRLRPGVLADFGLAAAITSTVDFWRRRLPETRFAVSLPPEEVSFGALHDTTIYRIVQESLSNAVRHGDPKEISVSVTSAPAESPEQNRITIEVANDGHGMDQKAGFGFGLTGMRERVHALGGSLVLLSDPGRGLSVTAILPVPATSNTGCHQLRALSVAGEA